MSGSDVPKGGESVDVLVALYVGEHGSFAFDEDQGIAGGGMGVLRVDKVGHIAVDELAVLRVGVISHCEISSTAILHKGRMWDEAL